MAKHDEHDEAAAIHNAHSTADGAYRWVEGAGGLYYHSGAFDGVNLRANPSEAAESHVPLPMVVLRCRCGDPDSHAQQGKHCPAAEVDLSESLAKSMEFNIRQ